MATNQQNSGFHASIFFLTDKELFTWRHPQKVADPSFIHLEELCGYTEENVFGLMSHFQLVLLKSSSLVNMLIRFFTPVDFYVSIQKDPQN